LDNEYEYFDYKIYCLQSSLNQFILNEVGEIINILKFNPNILKLYIEEDIQNKNNLKDYLKSTFKITKLSRTPAYGVKRIVVSNDFVNFSFKPCQVFLFLLSKPFADRYLDKKIKNTKLLSFLKVLNYTDAFYVDNYDSLIDNFYLLNNESILKEDTSIKINSDINLIKIKQINPIGYDILFSKYFDQDISDYQGLFETYDNELASLGFEVQYIIEKKNNFDFFVVYLAEFNKKESKDIIKLSQNIIDNINKLTLSRIDHTSNKFIRMLFNDKEYKSEYIDISKLLENFEKINNVDELIENIIKLKETHYNIIDVSIYLIILAKSIIYGRN
jgi:hypothetical protein